MPSFKALDLCPKLIIVPPRFDRYLETIRQLLWPDLVILGGGISKEFDRWSALLSVDVPLVPAQLRNHAGIVGAAMVVAA